MHKTSLLAINARGTHNSVWVEILLEISMAPFREGHRTAPAVFGSFLLSIPIVAALVQCSELAELIPRITQALPGRKCSTDPLPIGKNHIVKCRPIAARGLVLSLIKMLFDPFKCLIHWFSPFLARRPH